MQPVEPTEPARPRYPHLLRQTGEAWWRPVAGVAFVALLILVMAIGVMLVITVGAWLAGSELAPFSAEARRSSSPVALLGINLVLAVTTPAVFLTVWLVHRRRPGFLSSVTGRIRWFLLYWMGLLALAFTLTSYAAMLVLNPNEDITAPGADVATLVALLAVTVLTTPLQAAAEEYGFRGYASQVTASWIARPATAALVAGVVTAVLFALAHGPQDGWLFADRLVFGLVASWLVWRTGGLEASIALHAATNVVALVTATVTGTLDAALNSTQLSWAVAVADITTFLLFAGAADLLAKRLRVAVVLDPEGVGYPDRRLGRPVSAVT